MKKTELKCWKIITTGFGLGYSEIAPGTVGSLGATALALPILFFTPHPYFILLGLAIAALFLGKTGAFRLQSRWGQDPPRIVIDEIMGMWISILWIGTGWRALVLCFILFRFFDIVKPWGIKRSERLPRGWGVMADDLLAGVYANLIMQVAVRVFPMLNL